MTVLRVVKESDAVSRMLWRRGERRSWFPFQRVESDKGMSECAKERTKVNDCLTSDDGENSLLTSQHLFAWGGGL
jgi:hypothetical protein